MGFTIRMGIPEMLALWTELQTKHREIVCGSFLSGAADA